MKHISTLFALGLVSSTNAQLLNGSFENDAWEFALDGWEWTCEQPGAIADAPNGGGLWSASKEPGHAKGCWPSLLFQRLPDALNGELLELSGWVRCPVTDVQTCLGATIGFGVINSGVITPLQSVTSMEEDWTFVNVGTVFDPGIGDTAIVLLSAGFIGGPMSPLPAGFDQLTLEVAQSMGEMLAPHVAHYPDPVTDVLHIGITDGRILSIDVLDEAGRLVLTAAGGTGTRKVDVTTLPPGSYFGRVFTNVGEQHFPIVKR